MAAGWRAHILAFGKSGSKAAQGWLSVLDRVHRAVADAAHPAERATGLETDSGPISGLCLPHGRENPCFRESEDTGRVAGQDRSSRGRQGPRVTQGGGPGSSIDPRRSRARPPPKLRSAGPGHRRGGAESPGTGAGRGQEPGPDPSSRQRRGGEPLVDPTHTEEEGRQDTWWGRRPAIH